MTNMQGAVTYAGQVLPYTARLTQRRHLGDFGAAGLLHRGGCSQRDRAGGNRATFEKAGKMDSPPKALFRAIHAADAGAALCSGRNASLSGAQYRLKLIDRTEECVKLKGSFLCVTVKNSRREARVKSLVEGWYREKAEARLRERFEAVLKKFDQLKARSICLRLRVMKLRWGSHSRKGTITLNPEIIRAPTVCVDYVIAHELAHVVHPNHSDEFYELLCSVMSDWPARKERLERLLA